ncbi:FadR/GntR family transcriptional regulator [Lactiplantibacillus fabifermentans]|nr:GntR family transcriptional regulator [Lactiplantibacillus fabifermentans]
MEFRPIKIKNETEQMVEQFERAILTGELTIGEQLPSERELADQLQISRASVNRGLQCLSRRGFILIKPRQGNFVANYNENGNLETLNEIINFNGGTYRPSLLHSIFDVRRLFENDMIAQCNDSEKLIAVKRAFAKLQMADSVTEKAEQSFWFYHQIAVASGNSVYPLLILHFKSIYLTLGRWLIQSGDGPALERGLATVLAALQAENPTLARQRNNTLIDFCLSSLLAA